MTDKEKLIKIKSLADKMSDTAFNIATNASLFRKAMDEYHQFIINEYHKEEQIIKELQEDSVSEELKKAAVEAFKEIVDDERNSFLEIFKAGAEWKISKLMAKAIDGIARPDDNEIWCNLSTFNFKDGDKCKVILIKED